jgi:uncharacterized membrane protein AbrB (regulator of aidB expression)
MDPDDDEAGDEELAVLVLTLVLGTELELAVLVLATEPGVVVEVDLIATALAEEMSSAVSMSR